MRAAWLVLLAACFDPDPEVGLPCTDWCPPPQTCIARACRVEDPMRPNYAFVTSDRRAVHMNTGMVDDWCRERAQAENIGGEFVAWVSTQTSIAERLDLLAARAWIRPDGKPFADTVEDILAGKTYYPLRIGDDGADIGGDRDEAVATATDANGNASGARCDPDVADAPITVGKADAGFQSWTAASTARCGDLAHVYCFGTDRSRPLVPPVIEPGAKRAFLTTNAYFVKTPNDADLICRNEANDASFVALLATSTRSVAERFAGAQGPWVRADGVVVTEDMTTFLAPLEVTLAGTHLRKEVWFGAKSLTDRATLDRNCNDWTPGGSVRTGQSERSLGALPFDALNGNCSGEYHLYCAQL